MPNVYDKQGKLINVDSAEQAALMIESGQFAPQPGTQVQVTNATGDVFDVDAKDIGAALDSGMSIAAPEQVRQVDLQEKYGGIGGQAAAFGFHAADALGLNAATEALIQSKAKLHGVSPDVIRQEIMGLKEANPIASGAGTATGLIAPALFTGGAGLAADSGALTKGLYATGRALTAPGRAVGALGEGIAGIAGKGIASAIGPEAGFITKLATRGGTLAAQGGAEMAVYGGLSTIGEAALGDHELTAEKFLAGTRDGALAGLIGGGALGAASATGSAVWGGAKNALGRLRPRGKDVEALAERTFGEAADGLGNAYSKASAAVSGKDAETIRALTDLSAEGREARRVAVFEGDAIRDAAKRDVRAQINEMHTATTNLSPEWRELKASNVEKTIAKDAEAFSAQSVIAQDQLGAIRERMGAMLADPAAYGQRAALGKLDRFVSTAERDVAKAIEAGSGADAFVALDNLKRKMGPLARPGQMLSVAADAEVSREVRTLYDGLRDSLTDVSWGKAGEMQKATNAAYEKWFSTKNLFDDRLMTKTGKEGWTTTFGADPSKIDGYVNGLVSPKNDLTHSIIEQHISATKDLAKQLSAAGELTPQKAAELASITKAAENFEKTIGKAEKSLTLTNQLKALEQTDHAGIGLGALASGAVLGGPLGAIAGAAIGALANPARVVRQLASVERIAAKVDAKLGAGMKAFVHGEAAPVGESVIKTATHEGTKKTLEERFNSEAKAVREFAQNPTLATERIQQAYGGLEKFAPKMGSQLAFKAQQSAQVLASLLPQGSTPGGIMQHLEKVRYSDADMQKWLRAKQVIDDPVNTMLDGMHRDHLSPQDVKLVEQLYPKLYDQMKTMALTEMANVKEPPSYQRKMTLGILFGVPADATMRPDFIQMIQSGYAALAQPPPPPGGAGGQSPKPATTNMKALGTASEKVEGS